jgi:predicted RNA binding protein YcfA (HicA-like mRNA interferase family)
MKVRDIIKAIENDGWRFHSQKGSHAQYVHPTKPGRVTIAGKPGDDIHGGTLASIFRQAQMKKP